MQHFDTHTVPTWAAPYLMNGTPEGLNEQEIEQVNAYLLLLPKNSTLEIQGDEFFSHAPEFGAASMCVNCAVYC